MTEIGPHDFIDGRCRRCNCRQEEYEDGLANSCDYGGRTWTAEQKRSLMLDKLSNLTGMRPDGFVQRARSHNGYSYETSPVDLGRGAWYIPPEIQDNRQPVSDLLGRYVDELLLIARLPE